MAAPVRLFIAAAVPPGTALRRLMRELGELDPGLRLVDGDLHLTLKFLGDTPWERTVEVTDMLRAICERAPSCELNLQGIGAFPRLERPQVVWAGIAPTEPVVALAREIESTCAELGFPREDRPYRPHVTLARVKGRPSRELPGWIASHASTTFHGFELNEVTLYQSELRRSGPVYTPLASVPLAMGN
ncbi:MAG: RNA 2',3'-cyclic phosphodiesterase [Planctomycetaceae bacterium]|nr:RNA 2',3'-cyclic phosphodiesterase [Planctomycetaceae bacterium]